MILSLSFITLKGGGTKQSAGAKRAHYKLGDRKLGEKGNN